MRKVLSAAELADHLRQGSAHPSLDDVVIPTANDLLALTEAALSDVEGALPLTDAQRAALQAALRQRLLGALSGESDGSEHQSATSRTDGQP